MASRETNEALASLAALRAALKMAVEDSLAKGFWHRHPSGTPKGGQFAPTSTGGGSGSGGEKPPKKYAQGFKPYSTGKDYGSPMKWNSGGSKAASSPDTAASGAGKPSGMDTGYGGYKNAWSNEKPEKPKGPPAGAKPHVKPNDKGETVTINYPTKASHPDTWENPRKTATFVPSGDVPAKLNGIALKSWTPPADGWRTVKGTNEKLDEDFPFEPNPKKSVGAGVIVLEDDGRVWLTRPTNSFGGYENTYPKGTAESGLSMQQNAIKEAWEETGLKVQITGILGDYERDTSKARFYIARRTGGTPKDMGWESQAIRLATIKDAMALLNRSHDKKILEDFDDLLSFKKGKGGPKAGTWTQQPRWPSGSALGGQWKAMGADGITLPPKVAGGLEGKNPVYQKKLNAIHAAAQTNNVQVLDAAISGHAAADAKYASGAATSSHVKWGASVYQYAVQAKGDLQFKGKAVASADAINGPKALSSYGAQVGTKPGGSNPGAMYQENGEKWLVKGNAQKVSGAVPDSMSDDRAKNEVLAAKLLQAAGLGAPDMKLVNLEGKYGGGLGVASKMMGGDAFNVYNAAHVAAAQATFATHAWLSNYDVLGMGYDNTIITADGKATNIDPGGALLFRAQGLPKSAAHGVKNGLLDPTAPEFTSMRNTTAEQKKVFGTMTDAQLKASAQQLGTVTDDTIKKLVSTYGPGDEAQKTALANNLIARRDAILAKAGVVPEPAAPATTAATGAKPARPVAAPQSVKSYIDATKKVADKYLANGTAPALYGAMAVLSGPEIKAGFAKDGHGDAHDHIVSLYTKGNMMGLGALRKSFEDYKAGYSDPTYAALTSMVDTAMAALHAKQATAAQAITPTTALPAKPVFASSFAEPDAFYNNMVSTFQAQHASGDLLALAQFHSFPKLYADGKPWRTGTKNGVQAAAYHAALMADLQGKQAAVVVVAAKAQDAALSAPVSPPPQPSNLPAMPSFSGHLLSGTNANAPSHNKKVMQIKALADAGDVKGLLSMAYGTNTYGVKQVKLANSVLAALGSPHTVAAGQKKDNNPALTGGVSRAKLSAAASTVKQALPPTSTPPAVAAVKPASKAQPVFLIPDKPDFNNWKGAGQGLSSKPAINAQNDQLASQIHALAKAGSVDALKAMTFQPIDPASGQPAGSAKPIDQHPSQHVKAYHADALNGATTPYVAPKTLSMRDFGRAGAMFQKVVDSFKANEPQKLTQASNKIGRYALLGKLGSSVKALFDSWKVTEVSKATGGISDQTLYDQSISNFKKLSSVQQKAVKEYTGGGYHTMNNHKTGEGSHSMTGYALSGVDEASVPLKAGSVLSRRFSFDSSAAKAAFLASEGSVVKDFGIVSTSLTPAVWHGDVQLRITVGEGVKGLFVARNPKTGSNAISTHPGEDELILPYGTRFLVKKVHKKNHSFTDQHGTWGDKGSSVVVEVIALPNINP